MARSRRRFGSYVPNFHTDVRRRHEPVAPESKSSPSLCNSSTRKAACPALYLYGGAWIVIGICWHLFKSEPGRLVPLPRA
jgi:hypothetical protein